MKDVYGQLKRLESLANALIAEQQLLKKENQSLKSQRDELLAAVELKDDELQKLKAELSNVRLAKGLQADEGHATMAHAKLISLMREIDRCIALLNE